MGRKKVKSVVHSLPDGCVHVYGSVPWDAVQRTAAVPLKDGLKSFGAETLRTESIASPSGSE